MPLAKLQPEHVQALLAADHGIGADSLGLVLTVLRGALKRAVRNGHVTRNVASLVDVPPRPKRRVEPLDAEQAATLIAAARGHKDGAIFITILATGARLGEVLGLRWQDIDLTAAEMQINHTLIEQTMTLGPPKTESARRWQRLPAFAVEALRKHRHDQVRRRLATGAEWRDLDFVFCGTDGRPVRASTLRPRFYRLLEDARLPRKRLHDLRHSHASIQLAEGEELVNVSKALGHASLSTTANIYGHLLPKSKGRMADTMDRIANAKG